MAVTIWFKWTSPSWLNKPTISATCYSLLKSSKIYFIDQTGNTDYSQLHRWSPSINAGYKSPAPNDNSNYIYTSDYGSYSSQESNHSGTTCKYNVEEVMVNWVLWLKPCQSLYGCWPGTKVQQFIIHDESLLEGNYKLPIVVICIQALLG